MKIILSIILIITECRAQIPYDKTNYGIILVDRRCAGTGFVALTPNKVLTCFHAIDTSKKIEFANGNRLIYLLKLDKFDSKLDIAILHSDSILSNKPFIISDSLPNYDQKLYYLGYDSVESENEPSEVFKYDSSSALGMYNQEMPFLYGFSYMSKSNVGYSGGPVLDSLGNVLGINRIAINKDLLNMNVPFKTRPRIELIAIPAFESKKLYKE
ncbi:MAG: serine protease [Saprospiraceae bacterium]